jgi:hypothetical protein
MKISNILIFVSVFVLLSCSKQNSNTTITPAILYKFGFKVDGVPYSAEFEKGTLYNGNECSYSFLSTSMAFLNFHSTNNSISMNSQMLGVTIGPITLSNYTVPQSSFNLGLVYNSSSSEYLSLFTGDSIIINFQSVSPNSIQNSDSSKAGKAIGTFSGRLSSNTGVKKIISDGYFEAIRVK